jgi:hypothetical protein
MGAGIVNNYANPNLGFFGEMQYDIIMDIITLRHHNINICRIMDEIEYSITRASKMNER